MSRFCIASEDQMFSVGIMVLSLGEYLAMWMCSESLNLLEAFTYSNMSCRSYHIRLMSVSLFPNAIMQRILKVHVS